MNMTSRLFKITVICVLVSLSTCCMGCDAATISNNNESSQPLVSQLPDDSRLSYVDFSAVASQTIDAVVHIKTEMTKLTPLYQTFFGMIINQGVQRQVYSAYGSGVIISSDGYIVTNNHVVQDAERISVTLNDKRVVSARLVGNDPATDLAVIKIDLSGLQYIPFGNSDNAQIGEPVLAIGNPFNLTSTVTAGIISAKARNMNIIENSRGLESPIESFIQTDAAVNSGNSGGALVNGSAQLIGIVTAIASGNGYYTGYSFAIPSNIARKVTTDLREYGYVQRAYLGITVTEVTNEIAAQLGLPEVKGLYVDAVAEDCAAALADIRRGDVILSINNVSTNSFAEMMEELGRFSPGDAVEVTYKRRGQLMQTRPILLNSQGTTQIIRKSMK